MTARKSEAVLAYLHEHYASSRCSLDFSNPLQCLIAISLSAQSTDVGVNKVTPTLFKKYPDAFALANAPLEDIENVIRSLGLYKNKAKNLKALSECLVRDYEGEVPLDFDVLTTLPGVGKKTAGVFLCEIAARPAIPVDTHITRIASRLGYASKDMDPYAIEQKLEKAFPRSEWIFLHHALIWFGRNECKAVHPNCERCTLKSYCSFYKKSLSKIGR